MLMVVSARERFTAVQCGSRATGPCVEHSHVISDEILHQKGCLSAAVE